MFKFLKQAVIFFTIFTLIVAPFFIVSLILVMLAKLMGVDGTDDWSIYIIMAISIGISAKLYPELQKTRIAEWIDKISHYLK